jgi:hypothetical protein
MPLARARCPACTLPLGDAPHASLSVPCAQCGLGNVVRVAADGQPVDLDPAFSPRRLMAWLAAARMAMATGAPGVAVGACSACAAPLVVPPGEPVSLPCPHCGEAQVGTASTRLLDQWTEPWARVEGGGTQLEYRLAVLEAKHGTRVGCAVCGAPATSDEAARCERCGAAVWAERDGGRFQLAVRVDGTRGETPVRSVVSIVEGESSLRADASRAAGDRSGRSLLGAAGIGCAAAAAAIVVLIAIVWIAAHFAGC